MADDGDLEIVTIRWDEKAQEIVREVEMIPGPPSKVSQDGEKRVIEWPGGFVGASRRGDR
jgi:hypothetical protein